MNLKKIFTAGSVTVDLHGGNKQEIIRELMLLMVSSGRVRSSDLEGVIDAIVKRELRMSTGMQDGIAIPHAKSKAVKSLAAVLGIKKNGIDFDSIDGKPSTIFIATLSPEENPIPHVQFLAEISKRLRSANFRTNLINSNSDEELLANLIEGSK
ncbi:MAG TPA: PTS sugar transporter subunit IIA [bacterium]|jgi:PTS system nitrogen regulatory IIA component|nr:PTS sugar transporter subunit IIA [Myxococcales bacterium]OQA59053.1 MAG: PTS system fructose-specific EIIABC component [bacterium ADurb.Bin270]HPW45690.1 PTS sugar transporter subunit IIA [bacterium]HQC50607.1 PTS sugar transporter subunit IIA [bacterium]HQG13874.1 PTS sugar transporter subunit IIA [bacterium]